MEHAKARRAIPVQLGEATWRTPIDGSKRVVIIEERAWKG